jgi:hypothetical protein
MKVATKTVEGNVKVPTVTGDNLISEQAITLAINSHTLSTLKNGESGIRSYGFLASVVELTETKACHLVADFGADKGRLSKAKKCVTYVVSNIVSGESDIAGPEQYDEAIEYLVANYDSLNEAYDDINGTKEKKEPTLSDMVANLYKWADKNGVDRSQVVDEVTRQAN